MSKVSKALSLLVTVLLGVVCGVSGFGPVGVTSGRSAAVVAAPTVVKGKTTGRFLLLSTASAFATAADDNAIGTRAWVNPSNALNDNNVYATATTSSDETTHYLKLTNPSGLSIPGSATITGIQIDIDRKANRSSGTESVIDGTIKLVKGGSIVGNNKANTGINWPTTETTATYSADGDTWGVSWIPSDFGSGMGVVISANITDTDLLGMVASVDYVTVTVYYTASTFKPPTSQVIMIGT